MPRFHISLPFLAALACLSFSCRADSPTLSLQTTEPLAAFTLAHPLLVEITLNAGTEWHGFIHVECFDLLSNKSKPMLLPVDVAQGKTTKVPFRPGVPYGVYRVEAALVELHSSAPEPATSLSFAFAPAADPHQLPDDWPLGAHVTFDDPPLPGFKWYRYFSSWAEDNPAKDTYDWSHLDTVFARVRDIGGRLLIANDTTPSWTTPGKPITRPWVKSSTAFPPDEMGDLRAYLNALLTRFDNKAGTLGGLEVWNEANTPDRWQGMPEQMVAMTKIFREASAASQKRVQRDTPAKIVGIAVSSGHQADYVNSVIKAGILPFLDVVSGHWYEEMLSYDRGTPINSLPLHVDLLAKPMHAAGFSLPIWNTESGISSVSRENGRLVPQDDLNRRASTLSTFDSKQPWLLDKEKWRDVSERRAAASLVAGTAMLMSLGVEKTFVYSMRDQNWIVDGAPSLSWVALGVFGDEIRNFDYHTVISIPADGADTKGRTLAYRFGVSNKPGLIVAWSYEQDLTVGRPKLWQPWLNPQPVSLKVNTPRVEVIDLYGRERKLLAVKDGTVTLPIGEEPVYLRELPSSNPTR